jgi:hypothetical protein
MSWAVIISGLSGAALLALGFNMILPLSGTLDTACALAGAASAVVFFALVDGT